MCASNSSRRTSWYSTRMTAATSGIACSTVVVQSRWPASTRTPARVAVIDLVRSPTCHRSCAVTRSAEDSDRLPTAAVSSTCPCEMAIAPRAGTSHAARIGSNTSASVPSPATPTSSGSSGASKGSSEPQPASSRNRGMQSARSMVFPILPGVVRAPGGPIGSRPSACPREPSSRQRVPHGYTGALRAWRLAFCIHRAPDRPGGSSCARGFDGRRDSLAF